MPDSLLPPSGVQKGDVPHAAAQDNGIRIQDVENVRDGLTEKLDEPLDGLCRYRIGPAFMLRVYPLELFEGTGLLLVPLFQSCSGDDVFDTASLPAITPAPGLVQKDVAPLTGNAVQTVHYLPVHHDASAYARADNDAEGDQRIRNMGFYGAEERFRQGKAIGVVAHDKRNTDQLLQINIQRLSIEAEGVAVLQ